MDLFKLFVEFQFYKLIFAAIAFLLIGVGAAIGDGAKKNSFRIMLSFALIFIGCAIIMVIF